LESLGVKHEKFGKYAMTIGKYAMTRRAWQPLATGSDSGGQVRSERPAEEQMGRWQALLDTEARYTE